MKKLLLLEEFIIESKAKPGPDAYMTGLDDKTEKKKKEQMKKQAKMDDDDPDAYKEMPGSEEARKGGKTKTSDHTKKYHELYGDEDEKNESINKVTLNEADDTEKKSTDRGPLEDDAMETGLKNKAKESGVPIGILRAVMRRGLAAWKTGHRPGANQQQWGYARVNSFLTKGDGTWGDADSDLAKEVRDGGHDKDMKESYINESEDTYNDYPEAAKKNAQLAIDWKEKYGRDEVEAGTAVGWARAHQLAKGEMLSADTVGRMASFNRHRKNSTIATEFKKTPWLDKGYVSWLIWGGDEGVDWAMAKMDEISKTESINKSFLLGFDEFVNEKKSKPKTDKDKIKDLSKKQRGLAKTAKDIKSDILNLSKNKEKEPTDKLQGLLLKTQMQQSVVDAKKAEVQIQQIGLKAKLKTAKTKEKALKDAEKDNPKPEVKPKEKSNKDNPKTS